MLTSWRIGKGWRGRGEFVTRLTSEVPIFSVLILQRYLSFTSISLVWGSRKKEFRTGMFKNKGQIPSSIKWTWKRAKWRFYATFRTLGLISVVSYFKFNFSFDVDRLCIDLFDFVCKQRNLLTILHTHERRGSCLRKARVPENQLPHFDLDLCENKMRKRKIQALKDKDLSIWNTSFSK